MPLTAVLSLDVALGAFTAGSLLKAVLKEAAPIQVHEIRDKVEIVSCILAKLHLGDRVHAVIAAYECAVAGRSRPRILRGHRGARGLAPNVAPSWWIGFGINAVWMIAVAVVLARIPLARWYGPALVSETSGERQPATV